MTASDLNGAKRDRNEPKRTPESKKPKLSKEILQKGFSEIKERLDILYTINDDRYSSPVGEALQKLDGLYTMLSDQFQLNTQKSDLDTHFEYIISQYCVPKTHHSIKASDIKHYLHKYLQSTKSWNSKNSPEWLTNTRNFSEPMMEYINRWLSQSENKKWKSIHASRSGKGVATLYNITWKQGKTDLKIIEDFGVVKQKRQDVQVMSDDDSFEPEVVKEDVNLDDCVKYIENIKSVFPEFKKEEVYHYAKCEDNVTLFVKTNRCPISNVQSLFGYKIAFHEDTKKMRILCSRECQCNHDHEIKYE